MICGAKVITLLRINMMPWAFIEPGATGVVTVYDPDEDRAVVKLDKCNPNLRRFGNHITVHQTAKFLEVESCDKTRRRKFSF